MKRRICLAASLVGVACMAVGVAAASAASTPVSKKIVLKCAMNMSVVPPPGSPSVNQPPTSGWQYGHSLCYNAGFGSAAVASPFTVPVSDDTVGRYVMYFAAGTIRGTFDITPQEGDISNFEAESWIGTTRVTGGTGVYQGIRGLKTPGTMICSSSDTVHLVCSIHEGVSRPGTL